MPSPLARLPALFLRGLNRVLGVVSRLPLGQPPSIDGYVLDRDVWLALRLHAAAGNPALSDLSPEQARREHVRQASPFHPRARGAVQAQDIAVGDDAIAVRRYQPPGWAPGAPAIVWYHGGGWVIGSVDSDDALCRWIAEHTGCQVFSVEYRLAPEHPVPAPQDDAVAAWEGLAARADELGFDVARAAVAGSSAGGNLAAWVCLAMRDRPGPSPARQLLFYPVTDLTGAMPSRRTMARGFVLDQALIDYFRDLSVAPELRRDPRASVLFAPDVSGLPPAVVVTAGFDPLRDEGKAYADALRAAGVDVHYTCAEGQIHGFVELSGLARGASRATRDALDRLATGLRSGSPGAA